MIPFFFHDTNREDSKMRERAEAMYYLNTDDELKARPYIEALRKLINRATSCKSPFINPDRIKNKREKAQRQVRLFPRWPRK
jgi:hypothetical protein